MIRKYILGFVMMFVLVSCVGGVPEPLETITLKVTFSEQISYAPLLIAKHEGYFIEQGLEIEYVPFGRASEAVALLISGNIDVYAGTLNTGLLNAIYESGNIKVVADRGHIARESECTYQAIFVRKDLFESGAVTAPVDLKGLTLSASTAGPSAFVLSSYLAQGGLTFNDVTIVDLDVPAEIDSFTNKALDVSIAPEPNLTRLMNSGQVVMLAKAEDIVGTLQSGVIAFSNRLLVDHPDIGIRFMTAYLKAVRQYNEGKTDRNLAILSESTGLSVEDLRSYCWPDIRDDATVDFGGVAPFQQWSIEQGHLDQAVTEEQFWDGSILQEALKLQD